MEKHGQGWLMLQDLGGWLGALRGTWDGERWSRVAHAAGSRRMVRCIKGMTCNLHQRWLMLQDMGEW